MQLSRVKTLLISDRQPSAEAIRSAVEGSSHSPFQVTSLPLPTADQEGLPEDEFQLILMHLTHGGESCLQSSDFLERHAAETPVVVIAEGGAASASQNSLTARADDVFQLDDLNDPLFTRCLLNAIERRQLQNQVTHLTLRDPLTGLANRTFFFTRCERALINSHQNPDYAFAVLVVDLDHFQRINDSLGHELGDRLLVTCGQRLHNCVRNTDVVARFGADAFTILLDPLDETVDVTAVADRIRRSLSAPMTIAGRDVQLNASIGYAIGSGKYDSSAEILRDAHTALYRAKAAGRDRHEVFQDDMRGSIVEKFELESDLRHALDRDEFLLHFQPIVALSERKVIGLEALVRWEHPRRGLVPPFEFIPLAEETGLIVPLGRWVLRHACRRLIELDAQFPSLPPLQVSVNVSSKQLVHPDLLQHVDEVLEETGIDPRRLELEITESAIIENDQIAAQRFEELGKRGIRISIDDFGMGYSSLSYLHRFSFDVLKVDRSFVSRLGETDENSDVFVETIVTLAKTLGMEVVAEGVETEEQYQILRQLQCEFGQGYLFSKPLDRAGLAELLVRESHCGNSPNDVEHTEEDPETADPTRLLEPLEAE